MDDDGETEIGGDDVKDAGDEAGENSTLVPVQPRLVKAHNSPPCPVSRGFSQIQDADDGRRKCREWSCYPSFTDVLW